MTPISGLNVAITGAARGIGQATAERFARAGANVALGDLDEPEVSAAAQAIGSGAMGSPLDVTDRDSFVAFLEAAENAHGPLDVLVNNAGVDWMGPFHEEPDDVTRREIEVNLIGTITGARLAIQRMLPRGRGHIVNVSSGVGRVPLPGSAVYSATKHATVGLTESLRLEYAKTGLRFTLIQPSQVLTAMLDGQPQPRLMAQITPDDVAVAILDAVERNRFEVWVPRSQGATAKLGTILPRRAREAIMRAIGVDKIAGETDMHARRSYHDRMFGRS
jgi:NAD(P)-dependent dehydrogenase (short-subunit alcohol dehydrogenase family)